MKPTTLSQRKVRLAVPLLLPYRCYSPDCKRKTQLRKHITYLPGPQEPCPHCKERGYMIALAVIHLIQPEQLGILKVSNWSVVHNDADHRKRFDFLCEKSKQGFKEVIKSPNQPRHYTDLPESATCFLCLKEYNKVTFPRGEIIKEF